MAAKQTVNVTLLAKAAEVLQAHKTSVEVSATTPRAIIGELAKSNSLLADQLVRGDGTPRSSTRILINGETSAIARREAASRCGRSNLDEHAL
jgi:hypothetical protein